MRIAHFRRALRDHGAGLVAGGCSNGYFEGPSAQREPEQAVEVRGRSAVHRLPGIRVLRLTGDVNRLISLWMQQMAGTGRQWAGYDQYVVTENDFTIGAYYARAASSTSAACRPRSRRTNSISGSPRRGKR